MSIPSDPGPAREGGAGQGRGPRGRAAGLVIGFVVLALLVGGTAGALGGYFVARHRLAGPGPALPASHPPPVPDALRAPPPAAATARPAAGSVEAVAARVLPQVVELRYQLGGDEVAGSGVVISADGAILTNNHVVAKAAGGAAQIYARFHDGRVVPARIVGRDPTSDLAVVQAQGVSGLPVATLGRSDDLRVGQQVVAIGSPYELAGTVTSGIISALHRAIRAGGEHSDRTTVLDAIQTDAPITHGNSGGPLVNMSGEVIGINSAIYSPAVGGSQVSAGIGIGFAIPVDQARRIGLQLARTGHATQTTLGVRATDRLGTAGALVVDVTPGSAAAAAGLSPGDVVVRAGERTIGSADDLVAAVHAAAPGDRMTLWLADGSTTTVTLGGRTVGGG